MTNELITPQILLAVISSLIVCLSSIIWHFFKKMHDKIDKATNLIHDMGVRITEKIDDVEVRLTEKIDDVEVRLTEKIERLDREHDRTRDDLGKLFTQVGKLEGIIFGKEAR